MKHSFSLSKVGRVAAIVVGGLAAQLAHAAGTYYDLGSGITVSGISGNGSVAGAYVAGGSYYSWTAAGGVKSIGGVWEGGGASVSQDGKLISGSATGANGYTQAAMYNVASGTWTTYGGIGGVSGTAQSSAWGIAGNGSSLVGLGWVNAGSGHAIQSNASGGLNDLGSIGNSSRANATNYDGSVSVGWQELANGFWQGAYWKNGVSTLMTDASGDVLAEANAVSADGVWVVGRGINGGESYRFNTNTNMVSYLGDFDVFSDQNTATGISGDGKVIVGFDRSFGPPIFGNDTIWIDGLGIQSLTTYALGMGVDLGGRTLALPLGVSADGLSVYGIDNTNHGFVLALAGPVPEPETYALMALGLVGVGLAARRRKAAAK